MTIGFGKHTLKISIEKVAEEIYGLSALEGASDYEIETHIRRAHTSQDVRWQTAPAMFGFRI